MKYKVFFISYIILILNGCGIKPNPSQLNIVFSGDPKSIDPALATDVRSGKLCALLYDNLVRFGKSSEIIPSIASSWKVSSNGLKYSFKIREKIQFQNEEILQCEDVKESFQRYYLQTHFLIGSGCLKM